MKGITQNGIEFACIKEKAGVIERCELYPIEGIDGPEDLAVAIRELQSSYGIQAPYVKRRQPPPDVLVRIYLQDEWLVIEGAAENYGNLYCASYPGGKGGYIDDTANFLGITKEALPVFQQVWESGEDSGMLLGTLNWFHCDNGRVIFSWIGPRIKLIRPGDIISRRGDVQVAEQCFRLL